MDNDTKWFAFDCETPMIGATQIYKYMPNETMRGVAASCEPVD